LAETAPPYWWVGWAKIDPVIEIGQKQTGPNESTRLVALRSKGHVKRKGFLLELVKNRCRKNSHQDGTKPHKRNKHSLFSWPQRNHLPFFLEDAKKVKR